MKLKKHINKNSKIINSYFCFSCYGIFFLDSKEKKYTNKITEFEEITHLGTGFFDSSVHDFVKRSVVEVHSKWSTLVIVSEVVVFEEP